MNVVDAKPNLTSNKRRKKRSKQLSNVSSRLIENGEQDLNCTKHSYIDSEVTLAEILSDNSRGCTANLDGERCLLCHCERYGKCKNDGYKSHFTSDTTLSQLPLWVCPGCRKCVEEEERRAALDPTQLAHDLLCQQSLNLNLSPKNNHIQQTCCHHFNNYKSSGNHSNVDHGNELLELQLCWMDVRHVVRCIYRETGTCLGDGAEAIRYTLDENKVRPRVERLLRKDPHQLFERLEEQIWEYTREVQQRLVKFLNSCPVSPQHAQEFLLMLLDEYQALCTASDFLYPYFAKLELHHLKQLRLTWVLLNKHMFYSEVYRDSCIDTSIRTLTTQPSLGAAPAFSRHEEPFSTLLHRYIRFTDEMSVIERMWKECESVIQLYKKRQEKQKERNNVQRLEWENTKSQKIKIKSGDQDLLSSCNCGQCPSLQPVPSSLLSSLENNLSKGTFNSSHLAKCTMKNGISQPWLPSSCTSGNSSFCSSHFPTGLFSCDEMNDISPSQLLPTALMMNNLNTCQCPACLNCSDILCTDQLPAPLQTDCQCNKCPFHNGKELDTGQKTSDKSCQTTSRPQFPTPQCSCSQGHNHHMGHPTTGSHPTSSEAATSSPKNILSNGFMDRQLHSRHCHLNGNSTTEDWESDDELCDESEWSGDEVEHGQVVLPHDSIYFPDDVGLEAPPGSPNSVRSHGDGSSCGTPPLSKSNSSTSTSGSEESRAGGGKYCDCCYCEFFGHSAPPVAPTSHNYTEMRDKLRQRLTKRKPSDTPGTEKRNNSPVVDHRTVEELLNFIEGSAEKGNEIDSPRTKAQKRARQKQKKAAEKVRQDDPLEKDKENRGAESEDDSPNTIQRAEPSVQFKNQKQDNIVKETNNFLQKEQCKCVMADRNAAQILSTKNTENQVSDQKKKECPKLQVDLKNNIENRRNVAPHGHIIEQSLSKEQIPCPSKQQNYSRAPPKSHQTTTSNKKQKPRPLSCHGVISTHNAAKKQSLNSAGDSSTENGGHRKDQDIHCRGLGSKSSQIDSKEKQQKTSVSQQQQTQRPQQDNENRETTQPLTVKKNRQKKKKKISLDDVFLPREWENGELDETERELEEFKRFCLITTGRREKIPVNVNLKGICIKRNGST